MDLAVEVPSCEELGSVVTNAMWDEIYDRLAALAQEHRSTLLFVNTRRLVERLSHAIGEANWRGKCCRASWKPFAQTASGRGNAPEKWRNQVAGCNCIVGAGY